MLPSMILQRFGGFVVKRGTWALFTEPTLQSSFNNGGLSSLRLLCTTTASSSTANTSTTSSTTANTSSSSSASSSENTEPPRTRRTKSRPTIRDLDKAEAMSEVDSLKMRVEFARVRGRTGEEEIEKELEANAAKGKSELNKKVIEMALIETFDQLYPVASFHSKWLFNLSRRWAGDDFAAQYLLRNKGKNWYIFVATRTLKLWRETMEDFVKDINQSVVAQKVTIPTLLELFVTYYLETEPRKKNTYLEDEVCPTTMKSLKEVMKGCTDNLQDDFMFQFYTLMIKEYPGLVQLLTEEELRELLGDASQRLSGESRQQLHNEIRNSEILNKMPSLMELASA
jgi:hypothetical protein